MNPTVNPCRCGCGQTAPRNHWYVSGHNMEDSHGGTIRPAGMTYARALEIALSVCHEGPKVSVSPERRAKWTEIQKLNANGLTDHEIAERVGYTPKTIGRLRGRLGLRINSQGGSQMGHGRNSRRPVLSTDQIKEKR